MNLPCSGRILRGLLRRSVLLLSSFSALFAAGDAVVAAPINVCGSGLPASLNPSRIPFSALNTGDEFLCRNLLVEIGDPAELKLADDGRGSLEFEWNPFDPPGFDNDFFSLDFDFSPSQLNSSVAGFSYILSATDPAFVLDTVQLDSSINQLPAARAGSMSAGSPSSVSLRIAPDAAGPAIAPLISNRLDPQPWADLQRRRQVRLTNHWTVGPMSTIDNFKVTVTQVDPPLEVPVPVPLPLLGVGAALGVSRRLRRRLAQARRG